MRTGAMAQPVKSATGCCFGGLVVQFPASTQWFTTISNPGNVSYSFGLQIHKAWTWCTDTQAGQTVKHIKRYLFKSIMCGIQCFSILSSVLFFLQLPHSLPPHVLMAQAVILRLAFPTNRVHGEPPVFLSNCSSPQTSLTTMKFKG